MKKDKTLGQVVEDVKYNQDLKGISYYEAAQHLSKTLPGALDDAIKDGHKQFKGDFYIEVMARIHKHLRKTFGIQMAVRRTCPQPNYSEMVYKYHRNDGRLEMLWALPPRNVAFMYMHGRIDDGDEDQNLKWVVEFETGVLIDKYRKIRDADNKIIQKE